MDSQVEAASRKSRPNQRTKVSESRLTVPESFRGLCKNPFCFGETYHGFGTCSVTKPDNFHLQLPIPAVLSFNKMDDMSGCGSKGQCAGAVSTATKRFAPPKSKEDIEKARIESIPKKTRQDTAYCVRLWGNWSEYRRVTTGIQVPSLAILSTCKEHLQYWLIQFIHEIRNKNGLEY